MCIAVVLSICSAHRDPLFNTMIKPPCGKKAWAASESFLTQVLPVDPCLLLAKLGCRLLPFSVPGSPVMSGASSVAIGWMYTLKCLRYH